MVDRLTVDFAVLGGLADSLAAHLDATETVLGDVDQMVMDLEKSWEGDAQAAFHDRATEWAEAAQDLREELHRIREFVLTMHGNHATAVDTNVGIWRV